MKVSVVLVASFALMFICGCTGESNVEHLFGGRQNLDIVNHSSHIEAFRIAPQPPIATTQPAAPAPVPASQAWLRDNGWELVTGPVLLNHNQRNRLRRILDDPNTYDFDFAKACMFHPDVAVRFVPDDQRPVVTVVFCFTCNELAVSAGRWNTGIEDFDAQRPEVLRLVRELFPRDEYVKRLPASQP
jgi:hypothetical protein